MSGYPGGSYPGGAPAGGYPGGGYPGGGGGGYPGQQGGYPGQQGGYPGAPGAPPAGGYPGAGGAPPAGGYPGGAGFGAPQVDPNIASWFRAVDTDNSGQISPSELQRALVNGNWSNFSEEACRMMIGTIDFWLFLLQRCIIHCCHIRLQRKCCGNLNSKSKRYCLFSVIWNLYYYDYLMIGDIHILSTKTFS